MYFWKTWLANFESCMKVRIHLSTREKRADTCGKNAHTCGKGAFAQWKRVAYPGLKPFVIEWERRLPTNWATSSSPFTIELKTVVANLFYTCKVPHYEWLEPLCAHIYSLINGHHHNLTLDQIIIHNLIGVPQIIRKVEIERFGWDNPRD